MKVQILTRNQNALVAILFSQRLIGSVRKSETAKMDFYNSRKYQYYFLSYIECPGYVVLSLADVFLGESCTNLFRNTVYSKTRWTLTCEEVPRRSFSRDSKEWSPGYKWEVSYKDSLTPVLGQYTSTIKIRNISLKSLTS